MQGGIRYGMEECCIGHKSIQLCAFLRIVRLTMHLFLIQSYSWRYPGYQIAFAFFGKSYCIVIFIGSQILVYFCRVHSVCPVAVHYQCSHDHTLLWTQAPHQQHPLCSGLCCVNPLIVAYLSCTQSRRGEHSIGWETGLNYVPSVLLGFLHSGY